MCMMAEGNLVVGREILQLTETVVAEQEQRVGGGENLGGRVTLGGGGGDHQSRGKK